jgi:hypothetical protein
MSIILFTYEFNLNIFKLDNILPLEVSKHLENIQLNLKPENLNGTNKLPLDIKKKPNQNRAYI